MIALWFLALHMIGDYVTQTNWMAANKFVRSHVGLEWKDGSGMAATRGDMILDAALARTLHVAIYTLPFVLLAYFVPTHRAWILAGDPRPGMASALVMLPLIFVPHWIVDCRRWASAEPWPPKPIMVDQSLHALHLAIVGTIFYGL